MYNELESWMWVRDLDAQHSNNNYMTFDKFNNAPKRWLASLPMFEYAHVLTVVTAMRVGGKPEKFVDDLYQIRMNPILKEYYDKLAHYRFNRALFMRKYESMKSRINGKYLTDELAKMRAFAMKTRKALRNVCRDFELECAGRVATPRKTKDTLPQTYPV